MPNDPVPSLLARATEALEGEFGGCRGLSRMLAGATDRKPRPRCWRRWRIGLGNNYPYFHPLYAGQMLKPPHPVARAAYALAMTINPNNHARDGGRASSEMEIEAVAEIAGMFGWTEAEAVSGASDVGRDDGESGSAVGGGAGCAGQADCGVGAGALHAWADFGGAQAGFRGGGVGPAGADAAGCAGRRVAQGRCGHGGGDAGDNGDWRG